MTTKKHVETTNDDKALLVEDKICGIIMPISAIDGCNESHWIEVKAIIEEAVEAAGFKARLVSYADDVNVIQKTIVNNLYNDKIVICDVSAKNANVMFELGMRLAFDKPTIIIKDDQTSYSFDTSVIEHLTYPRDLRFSRIVDFKKQLSEKLSATLAKADADNSYSPFLKSFGTFTVAKLDQKEVSASEGVIVEALEKLDYRLSRMETGYRREFVLHDNDEALNLFVESLQDDSTELLAYLKNNANTLKFQKREDGELIVIAHVSDQVKKEAIRLRDKHKNQLRDEKIRSAITKAVHRNLK